MRIGVLGAGRIGSALGIRLSGAGAPVTLVDRRALPAASELRLLDPRGRVLRPGPDLVTSNDPAALRDVDLCIVSVPSHASSEAAEILKGALGADALVVSFQNGLRNVDRMRRHLSAGRVVPGLVAHNVVREGDAALRQTTRGPLAVGELAGEPRLSRLRELFARSGVRLLVRREIVDLQAGKLLLNLNNGVCAVTGVGIAASVRSRPLRRCFAALIREGERVLRADGFRPRGLVGLPPWLIARALPLPDLVVLGLGRGAASIDPAARSSTLSDLLDGRPTEIEELGGEIVRRARALGTRAPRNALVVRLVRELERAGPPFAFLDADELESRLRAARWTGDFSAAAR